MKLNSLSASSAKIYEGCPARWKVEYADRAPSLSGSAANLGTADHEVLEVWVRDGHHKAGYTVEQALDVLRPIYEDAYWRVFMDRTRFDEGWDLASAWVTRTIEENYWQGREVLTTEIKQNFILPTSAGDIPFNYVWDRCDAIPAKDGIEVIDYKTTMMPLTVDLLKGMIQARCYALAAQVRFPDAERVFVTFDQLRYDRIGVVFTREENQTTLEYLSRLAERIITDDEAPEVLNEECRFCIRKHRCETLGSFQKAAGDYTTGDIATAMARRAKLQIAKVALESQMTDLDAMIEAHLKANDLKEYESGGHIAYYARGRATRSASVVDVMKHVPLDALVPMMKLNIKDLETYMATLDDETASCVRQAIRKSFGRPSLRVKVVKDPE